MPSASLKLYQIDRSYQDTLEGKAATKETWVVRNVKFSTGKFESLLLGQINPRHKYKLGTNVLKNSFAV